MKYIIEAKSLSKVGRMHGLKSSHLHLELLENRLNRFDYEDFMRSKAMVIII